MKIDKKEITSKVIRFSIKEDDVEIARAHLCILHNDLHEEPFGLMEDVFVDENYRGKGYGKSIVQLVIKEAEEQGCYKLIGTSRYSREHVHKLYEDLGFIKQGIEFRIDYQ